MQFRRHRLQCISPTGLHTISYKEWGDPKNEKVLICVHGVTRCGDDFDALAQAMADEYRVICPDIVGRGFSDRLRNPMDYQIAQYVADMVSLIARANVEHVHWVGTSMGGLIGMAMAGLPNNAISKLVLNDVGPALEADALERIAVYLGQEKRFETFADAVAYVREVSAPFGPHSDAEWEKLTHDVVRQNDDGSWRKHYDLGIAIPIRAITPEVAKVAQTMLWQSYDAIQCSTLLIRGSESDLLSRSVAQEMQQRGPQAKFHEFEGVGHAPTLIHADQIAVVREFLLQA